MLVARVVLVAAVLAAAPPDAAREYLAAARALKDEPASPMDVDAALLLPATELPAAAGALLAANAEALRHLRTGMAIEACDFDLGAPAANALLRKRPPVMELHRLSRLHLLAALRDGAAQKSWSAAPYVAALRLARHLEADPGVVGPAVAYLLEEAVAGTVAAAVARGEVPATAARALAGDLASHLAARRGPVVFLDDLRRTLDASAALLGDARREAAAQLPGATPAGRAQVERQRLPLLQRARALVAPYDAALLAAASTNSDADWASVAAAQALLRDRCRAARGRDRELDALAARLATGDSTGEPEFLELGGAALGCVAVVDLKESIRSGHASAERLRGLEAVLSGR